MDITAIAKLALSAAQQLLPAIGAGPVGIAAKTAQAAIGIAALLSELRAVDDLPDDRIAELEGTREAIETRIREHARRTSASLG